MGLSQCKTMYMLLQRFLVSMMLNPQAHLSAFTPNRANDRRSIILISAVSALLIRPTAGWICRVKVFITFFPRHSETFRRFQYARLEGAFPVGLFQR